MLDAFSRCVAGWAVRDLLEPGRVRDALNTPLLGGGEVRSCLASTTPLPNLKLAVAGAAIPIQLAGDRHVARARRVIRAAGPYGDRRNSGTQNGNSGFNTRSGPSLEDRRHIGEIGVQE